MFISGIPALAFHSYHPHPLLSTSRHYAKTTQQLILKQQRQVERRHLDKRHVHLELSKVGNTGNLRGNFKKTRVRGRKDSWITNVKKMGMNIPIGQMTRKDVRNIKPVIVFLAKCGEREAAKEAEILLRRMLTEVNVGNSDVILTNKVFNAVINGYAIIGDGIKAESILYEMCDLHKERGFDTKPDSISITTCIKAFMNNGDGPTRAEKVLEVMRENDVELDAASYNALISAWAKSNTMDKGFHAERIFSLMKKSNIEPNIHTYIGLITAWAKSKVWGAPQRCEEVLQILLDEYKGGRKDLCPDTRCFASAINGWAKSKERNKARSAYKLLQLMTYAYTNGHNQKLKPNVVVYTSVLNACYPLDEEENSQAFEIAYITMQEMLLLKFDKPNDLTYSVFIGVCAQTLPEGERRDEAIKWAFQSCCCDGQVGDGVIKNIEQIGSKPLIEELFGEIKIKCADFQQGISIPESWTRNVDLGHRRRNTNKSRNEVHQLPLNDDSLTFLNEIKEKKGNPGKLSRECHVRGKTF
jgi:hypothetical protein